MGALPIPSKAGSEVLLYMIFAMGAYDSSFSHTDSNTNPGSKYYAIARAAVQRDILEQGTLSLVQGLGIMAFYLQRSNRPNAGYMALGWAIRMALALGLHTPVTSWKCTALEREMRVRVWWGIITIEAGSSVTFGRPSAIGTNQLYSVPTPINTNDENLTVSTQNAPGDLPFPTLYTALVVQSRLARVTCSVHDRILHSDAPPTVEQIREYDEKVDNAMKRLPEFMRLAKGLEGESVSGEGWLLARRVQVWRARDFRAILYRPVLLAAAWDSLNRKELSRGVREAIE